MMNTRLQELAIKAGRTGLPYGEIEIQKFAELIVQECLMKAIGAKIRGESIDTLIQNIKEDFGVQ
jgi:hypothetical protein